MTDTARQLLRMVGKQADKTIEREQLVAIGVAMFGRRRDSIESEIDVLLHQERLAKDGTRLRLWT